MKLPFTIRYTKNLTLNLRFKACILLDDNEARDDKNWMYEYGCTVRCNESVQYLYPPLEEHMYVFEVEADVTSSELVFEFKIKSKNWKIKECGVFQLSEAVTNVHCKKLFLCRTPEPTGLMLVVAAKKNFFAPKIFEICGLRAWNRHEQRVSHGSVRFLPTSNLKSAFIEPNGGHDNKKTWSPRNKNGKEGVKVRPCVLLRSVINISFMKNLAFSPQIAKHYLGYIRGLFSLSHLI
ncbi:predicted protein [Arabidopsis lyrata subsp. lyrata]|uniref:Predicted protein n=1 Tax=Arabidopsis lyrata subsp. lyrata TaxID=81972 RepID=D7MQS2_ARALL|nr:predicted protein [Arabidopsis lyrata subsp. lyrata]